MDGGSSPRPCRTIRRGLATVLLALGLVLLAPAAAALASPLIEIETPAPGSVTNDRTPVIAGLSSDSADELTVTILSQGSPVTVFKAQPQQMSGQWAAQSPVPLEDGPYTVVAEQLETFSGETGSSGSIGFSVHASKPVVTLDAPPSPSNDSAPAFSGTASEKTLVTVHVYRAGEVGGTIRATAYASGTGGKWSSGGASPTLPDGTYTAVAEQESEYEDGLGRSEERTFVVDSSPPVVTLNPVTTPSNDTTPSFSGFAGDTTNVVVHVLENGGEIASAEATPVAGKWKTGPLSQELPSGEHAFTAYATQASSLEGNPSGKSGEVAFVVDTNRPTVTLDTSGFATPSNNTSPTFSGTASDTTPVTVVVTGGGKKYEASAPVSGGQWSAGPIKLPAVKATYTALAIEPSSLGNPAGESKPPFKFVVDPGAPSVSMSAIGPQIDTSTPTFTGSASDNSPVTVSICRIATSPCEAQHGEWSAISAGGYSWTASLSTPLQDGEYRAVASERTGAGGLGASAPRIFTVDTSPPAVGITAPAQGTSVSGSTVNFRGEAGTARHDKQLVTLQLFRGGSASGAPVQTVAVAASGNSWSATLAGIAPGVYTARVSQPDEAGNVGVSERSFTDLAPAAPAGGPNAAFTWYPPNPHVGETVTLVSASTDESSPIISYAWNTLGSTFTPGPQTRTTSFATTGDHLVQLRATDGAGMSSTASAQIPVSYQLMSPFPVVRIVTTRTRGRVRLTLLSVQAPAGAAVSVTCTGKGCPLRSQSRVVQRSRTKPATSAPVTFVRFERSLPAGVGLQIRVSLAGTIGKYTRFAIRKGKLPLRTDACLNSTESKAVPCPH